VPELATKMSNASRASHGVVLTGMEGEKAWRGMTGRVTIFVDVWFSKTVNSDYRESRSFVSALLGFK
jgi:hypothetical protein